MTPVASFDHAKAIEEFDQEHGRPIQVGLVCFYPDGAKRHATLPEFHDPHPKERERQIAIVYYYQNLVPITERKFNNLKRQLSEASHTSDEQVEELERLHADAVAARQNLIESQRKLHEITDDRLPKWLHVVRTYPDLLDSIESKIEDLPAGDGYDRQRIELQSEWNDAEEWLSNAVINLRELGEEHEIPADLRHYLDEADARSRAAYADEAPRRRKIEALNL